MNIEDMLKNMNPKTLSDAAQKLSNILTPQQMQQVKQAIQSTNMEQLNQKLSSINSADLQREIGRNPALAKEIANNPEIMEKMNRIINNK